MTFKTAFLLVITPLCISCALQQVITVGEISTDSNGGSTIQASAVAGIQAPETVTTVQTTQQNLGGSCKDPVGDWFYQHGWSKNFNGQVCTCINGFFRCGPSADLPGVPACPASGCTCMDYLGNFEAESGWSTTYDILNLQCTCTLGYWNCSGINGAPNRCIQGFQLFNSGEAVQVDSRSCTCNNGFVDCGVTVAPTPTPTPTPSVPTIPIPVTSPPTIPVTIPVPSPPTIPVPSPPTIPVTVPVPSPPTIPVTIPVPSPPSIPVTVPVPQPVPPTVVVPPGGVPISVPSPPTVSVVPDGDVTVQGEDLNVTVQAPLPSPPPPPTCFTIYDTLVAQRDSNGEFAVLISAIDTVNLQQVLDNETLPITLFAPTNQAFQNLLDALQVGTDVLLADPLLQNVLLYHVATQIVNTAQIQGTVQYGTLNGQNLSVTNNNNGVFTVQPATGNTSTILQTDVPACSGVIQVVDSVLLPVIQ